MFYLFLSHPCQPSPHFQDSELRGQWRHVIESIGCRQLGWLKGYETHWNTGIDDMFLVFWWNWWYWWTLKLLIDDIDERFVMAFYSWLKSSCHPCSISWPTPSLPTRESYGSDPFQRQLHQVTTSTHLTAVTVANLHLSRAKYLVFTVADRETFDLRGPTFGIKEREWNLNRSIR